MSSHPTNPSNSANSTPVQKPSKRYDGGDVLVFLIPCIEFTQLKAVGVIGGSELVLIGVFVFFVLAGKVRIEASQGKLFLVLCSLWLASQCITDIVRHSAFADYARGWSNIGMTLINFSVLCTLLYGRRRRLVLYGWGLVVGGLLRYFISPDQFALDYPWKFGLSDPLTLAVVLFASNKRSRDRWPAVLVSIIGLINIYLGARYQGGVCLAAALYMLIALFLIEKKAGGAQFTAGSIFLISVALILSLVGVFWAYKYAASTGLLGEEARLKYESQSSGQWGVLLGGRTEMLGSIPAIYDSPILGHGSWAKDPGYLIAEREALALMGYEDADRVPVDVLEEGLIPSHSYFFGAWVYAGALGAVFFGWVFWFAARTLMKVDAPTGFLFPLVSYVAFSLIWNILFSPYGAEVRIIFPYYVLILMTFNGVRTVKVAGKDKKMIRKKLITRSKPVLNAALLES